MPKFYLDIFFLGCAGGLIPDLLRLIKGRYEPFPKFYTYPSFWLGLILLIGLGGACAWLCGATDFKSALAFGYGAPEIISKLLSANGAATTPTLGGEKAMFQPPVARSFDLLHWWKG